MQCMKKDMRIVDKMKLFVIPMVLIPFLIIMIGMTIFGRIYIRNIFAPHNSTSFSYTTPLFVLGRSAEEDIFELREAVNQNPDILLDEEEQQIIRRTMGRYDVHTLVVVEGQILYVGYDGDQTMMDVMPAYGTSEDDEGRYVEAEQPFYLYQQDFVLSDGRQGSLYIYVYVYTLFRNMRRAFWEMIFVIIAVLILINSAMSIYIYKIFLKPLRYLKEGTDRIKEGNLEQDVEILSGDEIGEVCESFNEMRVKLKESVDDQMRQEEENRELISNISHDLKTPITAIKGYVEGIMDGVADTPEKMDRYIKTIYNKANEMDVLINELSLYSKIDNNSMPYNFEKIKVNAYFNDCMEDISMDMEKAGVSLGYHTACDNDLRMVADPEQLRRVVNNIVTNAVKYNKKEQRSVDIEVKSKDAEYVYVGIRDNGDGIREEDLQHIFKRMYRGDASRNSSTGGNGLGLSIAKKIIEEHGGTIWAESQVGTGTLIAFTLKKYLKENGGQAHE